MKEIMIVREDSTSYATTSLLVSMGMEDTCIGISKASDGTTPYVHIDPTPYQFPSTVTIPVTSSTFTVANTEVWAATAKTKDSNKDYLILGIYDQTSNATKGVFINKESDPVVEDADIYQRCMSMFGYIPTFVKIKSSRENGKVVFQPDKFYSDNTDASTIPAHAAFFAVTHLASNEWQFEKDVAIASFTISGTYTIQVSWIDSSKFDSIDDKINEVYSTISDVEDNIDDIEDIIQEAGLPDSITDLSETVQQAVDTIESIVGDLSNIYVGR